VTYFISTSSGEREMKSLYLEHDIRVVTYDIDFAGHVSNTVYLYWLEDMRLKMFDLYCPLQGLLEIGLTPVLVSTEIRYIRPIRLFDKPKGKMWVSELGLSTLTIEAEIYLADTLTTTARHVGVFVNMNSMKPARLPKVFRDVVSNYAAASAG
jgi:acyl-CoA thioester hydrolase